MRRTAALVKRWVRGPLFLQVIVVKHRFKDAGAGFLHRSLPIVYDPCLPQSVVAGHEGNSVEQRHGTPSQPL